MRINLGDIVTMPLPTEWSPDVQYDPINFPAGPPTLAQPPNASLNVQSAPGTNQQVATGPTGPFPNIPPAVANAGSFGYPGADEVFGSDGGGGVPYPAGSGIPSDFGAGYGAGIPGGYGGEPGGGYGAGGPFPGGGPLGRPLARGANPWARQAVLPDAVLPPALQRSNPSIQRVPWIPNKFDYALMRSAWFWAWVQKHGGLKSCCRIPELGAPVYDVDPVVAMPNNGLVYRKPFAQPISAFMSSGAYTGLDVILGQWRVPEGYDGVINRVVCSFTGNGFQDFSGNIVWRVQVGLRYPKDYGNITATWGDYQTAFLIPGSNIPIISGQTVTVIANVPAGSPVNGGYITAGTFGWLWPRR